MADALMSLFCEDEARREVWRASHLLLSVPVPVPVPENLTRLFRWKTAPQSLPLP